MILLDLIDERLGVLKVGSGYVTYSNELKHSGALDLNSDGPLVEFGSDEHFDLWAKSADELREILAPQIGKVRFIAAQFAEKMEDGTPLELFRGTSASAWNKLYERYYEHADQLGFNLVEQEKELIVSTPQHKWGATPFHYVDDSYLNIGSKILGSL